MGTESFRVKKKNMHTQIQIKPCGSWRYIDVLRHETIGLCEKLNSISIISDCFYGIYICIYAYILKMKGSHGSLALRTDV